MLPRELEEEIEGLLANLRRLETEVERLDDSLLPTEQQQARDLLGKCGLLRNQIRDLRQDWEEQSDIAAMRDTASGRAYARRVQ